MSGKVISINISKEKGVIKHPVVEALLEKDFGIVGDAHAGSGIRQVSLLANESINKMRAQGIALESGMFAENLTTEGIELHTLKIGTRLQIGETIQEVSKIGKECHHGCAIKQQTGSCIMPTEGIFTIVIKGGTVKVNDEINILEG